MRSSEPAINRVVLSQERQDFHNTRSVAPVPHEIAHDAEQADKLDARVSHAVVGHVADEFGGGSRSLDVGPDAVAVLAEGQGAESSACMYCQQAFPCALVSLQVRQEFTHRRPS